MLALNHSLRCIKRFATIVKFMTLQQALIQTTHTDHTMRVVSSASRVIGCSESLNPCDGVSGRDIVVGEGKVADIHTIAFINLSNNLNNSACRTFAWFPILYIITQTAQYNEMFIQ